ncbi:MAG: segregation/condensation protein A, partial [Halobacteriaceae archaeon]
LMPEELASANAQILEILLERDEINWKTLIYELVREEEMNPWDVNVTALAKRFLELIQELKETDFRITGKLVLAAALLLKIKSDQLLEEDITALDSLIEGAEEPVELLEQMPEPYEVDVEEPDPPELTPRTPQPRERKVSLHDLVGA